MKINSRVNGSGLARALLLCLGTWIGFSAVADPVDPSGTWVIAYHEDWIERGTGPDIGEYQGLPINEAARQRALNWHASLINQPERQCMPLPLDYGVLWSNFRIWKVIDEKSQALIAYRFHREWQSTERTIWMDGRAHPPQNAAHSYQGFSTGEWEGDVLKVTTTHLKEGYSRRNGVPRSDQSTIVEHYIRNGGYLTISRIVNDPLYLTEPLIHTSDYVESFTKKINPYPCEIVVELTGVTKGFVPHYFPWKNPFVDEHSKLYNLSREITMGGALQMYPAFIEQKPTEQKTAEQKAAQKPTEQKAIGRGR